MMSHAFAHWYGRDGVISICLEPGDLTTPRTPNYVKRTSRRGRLRIYHERTALGRSGSPDELVRIIAAHLDPSFALTTGSVVTADSGYGSRF